MATFSRSDENEPTLLTDIFSSLVPLAEEGICAWLLWYGRKF
jgi:hypothetical protein